MSDAAGSVDFADYDPEWLEPEELGWTNQLGVTLPPGVGLFCERHLDRARALTHLPALTAVVLLANQDGQEQAYQTTDRWLSLSAHLFACGSGVVDEEAPLLASALRIIIVSLARDLAVMREMLEARGLWAESEFGSRRLAKMIDDGTARQRELAQNHAIYPHTLADGSYLREIMQCDAGEVERFWSAIKAAEDLPEAAR